MASFDLNRNPFAILDLSPRDGANAISDAYERALIDGQMDEQILLRAQQALMTSKSRLESEISWLFDVAPARVQAIIKALRKVLKTPPKGRRIKSLPREIEGLARANLAAHICANSSLKGSSLRLTLLGNIFQSLRIFTPNWTGNYFCGIFIEVSITVNRRLDPLRGDR